MLTGLAHEINQLSLTPLNIVEIAWLVNIEDGISRVITAAILLMLVFLMLNKQRHCAAVLQLKLRGPSRISTFDSIMRGHNCIVLKC